METNIHEYTLVPLGDPPDEEEPFPILAPSPDEALFHSERAVASPLELCDDGTAEFRLETRLRSLGAGRPGELVEIFYARRRKQRV
jgi:hypothetical protein